MSGADAIRGLYERHATAFDRIRGRQLFEKTWLDRFTAGLPRDGTVLDLGCGAGEPMAAYLIDGRYRLTGIDSAPSLTALCRDRFPGYDWRVGDMREVAFGRRFHGILAWHSFFHLTPEDQRDMFPRFAAHAAKDAMLMFTSGPTAGVVVGEFEFEPLYHASLDPQEYQDLLAASGFDLVDHLADDPDCGGATVWLARRR
ncbi:class I SAM-dependent methyltransferase [Rhizobium sp. RU36D]|uniref:class I SAM-dependent methyltransferase n=1 Tax=Rhizobium sp. RU36D TaxID=1907415 RepID=UPI0009D866C7|nr:class I SAM-dependent methyltransferase [Rhizobium sp. RU36D]SMD16664.1 Methyltransferase domain-containing protein [Rhizobium sp. RU36D]